MASTTNPPEPTQKDQHPKCRYRLDNNSSSTLVLPDGRKLGYAEYGSPTGDAILYQHGLPGSRLEAAAWHDLAMELGARIIAIDRPGMGTSSPCPSRTVLSWAQDIQHLTQHLELKTYAVMGVSGGGPYTLACAAALPEIQLKCVCVICGLGPPDLSMWKADWMHWLGFPYGWRYAPVSLSEWFFRRDAFGRMELSDEERMEKMLEPKRMSKIKSDKDRRIMGDRDVLRLGLRASREAHAQGFGGIAQDGKVMCSEWGFRVEDIRRDLPVLLWYGKDDTFVPPNHGLEIKARLGGEEGKAVLRLEDDTHYSISHDWRREQLEGILAEMRR